MFDFSVTAYHIVDWVKSFRPDLASAAYAVLDSTPALLVCRDLANANKHFRLDLKHKAYRDHPPTVSDVEYSAVPQVSARLASEGPQRRMKVQYMSGDRLRVEDVADEALRAWETFFGEHGLAP